MKIEVKQHHISQGSPRIPCGCALALACKEAGLYNPEVTLGCVFWDPPISGPTKRAHLPKEAIRFMADFDRGRETKPFSFDIEAQVKDLSFEVDLKV